MPTNLQVNEKNSFTYSRSCISPSFSKNASRLLFPKSLWKCASTISFRKYKRKVALLVICLFNYDSSKFTFFMLNIEFDVLLSAFLSNKLEFFVSCKVKIIRTSFFLLCFDMSFFIKSSLFSTMMIMNFYSISTSALNSHFQQ